MHPIGSLQTMHQHRNGPTAAPCSPSGDKPFDWGYLEVQGDLAFYLKVKSGILETSKISRTGRCVKVLCSLWRVLCARFCCCQRSFYCCSGDLHPGKCPRAFSRSLEKALACLSHQRPCPKQLTLGLQPHTSSDPGTPFHLQCKGKK